MSFEWFYSMLIYFHVGFILDEGLPRDINESIKIALTISNISCSRCDVQIDSITLTNSSQKIFLNGTIVETNISNNYNVSQVGKSRDQDKYNTCMSLFVFISVMK